MEICNTSKSTFEPVYNAATPVADKNIEARPRPARENVEAASGDTVNVSRDALLLTEALRAAQNAPDVRADKVDALRAKIANGVYEIDARRIAASLIREDPGLFRF